MMLLKRWRLYLLICGGCFGQSQAPATADELQYFRFMLMNVASLDHGSNAIKMYEDSLVKQFGLNPQEAAAIHGAAQSLNGLLIQLQQSEQAIKRGKSTITAADEQQLSALSDRRE